MKARGQGLAEYCLMGGLLLLVALGGLALVSGTFNTKQEEAWNSFTAAAPVGIANQK